MKINKISQAIEIIVRIYETETGCKLEVTAGCKNIYKDLTKLLQSKIAELTDRELSE